MANDFSSDSDCKAVWNFESGAPFAEDSKGGNDFTNYGMDEDTTDYKQGSCSARAVRANTDQMEILDADLDSGFPLKSGETNKSFSFIFWLYLETIGISQRVIIKEGSGGSYCFVIYVPSSNQVSFIWSSDGTSWDNVYTHASTLAANTWYHIAVTRDDSDNSYRIRIWDDTAQAILGTDKTGTGDDININTAPVALSHTGASITLDGNLDEMVVWGRVLSVTDIDRVRAGTYSGASVTVTPAAFALALTLQVSTVTFPLQTMLPGPFSLALTQHVPSLNFDYQVTPATLELALTQHVPIIIKNTLSWSAGLLTYKGVTYEISAGITIKRFVYWDPNYTTVFRDTDVLQDVFDADGWVMCLNESGVAYPAFARKLIHGGIIQAGTITAEYGQIAALTVGSAELKDLAVDTAKIGNLQVSSAKIADLTVGTGKITVDAITKAAEDFNAAEQDCGAGITNVAAAAITLVAGGFVKIEASVTLAFDALNTTISVRVRRTGDSTDTLYTSNSIAWIGGGEASFAPLLSDSPGAGSYTYTLAIISSDANVHAYNACIIAQQFKR